jgi:uncharacterized membrane protein
LTVADPDFIVTRSALSRWDYVWRTGAPHPWGCWISIFKRTSWTWTMYEFFKALHIFGLILMAGNVTVTAFWKVFADRTCKTQIISFAQWLVTVTDFTFTLTGGFLMVIGGYGAALVGGIPLFETPWLVLGQLMLLVSGGIWLLILVPIQIRQARYARDFAIIGDVPEVYKKDSRTWLVWGLISTVPLTLGMYSMVFKPYF